MFCCDEQTKDLSKVDYSTSKSSRKRRRRLPSNLKLIDIVQAMHGAESIDEEEQGIRIKPLFVILLVFVERNLLLLLSESLYCTSG